MRILFLSHAFNSLTQRLFVELEALGHEVSVEFDINDSVAREAVLLANPDLILAPFLKRPIAESIWQQHVCFVVHPGIPGDRGPSSLDWAILQGKSRWGVTVLQANAEMDGGDIWASCEFPMRQASKGSLYRNEVTEAAVKAVLLAVARFQSGDYQPLPQDRLNAAESGQWQPLMTQQQRQIDWQQDNTEQVMRKLQSGDGMPGVKQVLFDQPCHLYDASVEKQLQGKPGEVIAKSGPAICIATIDGAVWIGHLKLSQASTPFKLPASKLLADQLMDLPEVRATADTGYREIWYEQADGVGYLHFPFYNGAMSSQQCCALLEAYREAKQCDTQIIVLLGGPDYWSNGMHLNMIEAAESAADASWENINAINDLALEIITTDSHLTISALQGNAGAGGVFLARAADEVWARSGVILNPHYKDMGNLYGSEYWSYLLPRYVGEAHAKTMMQNRLPMGAPQAAELQLVDRVIDGHGETYLAQVRKFAEAMISAPAFAKRLHYKRARRSADELQKPLSQYREQELEQMKRNFYGFDPSYHIARYNFVHKIAKSRTPLTIARHRRTDNQWKCAS